MELKVNGMMCMHCVKSVTDALNAMDGVSDVSVTLETKMVSFSADPSLKEKIVETIEDLGFEVE